PREDGVGVVLDGVDDLVRVALDGEDGVEIVDLVAVEEGRGVAGHGSLRPVVLKLTLCKLQRVG
ncbi:MAG: hypothetical protein V7636_1814, partial [Actinomycetota bacterium]